MSWTLNFVSLTWWVLKLWHMFQSFAVWLLVSCALQLKNSANTSWEETPSLRVTCLYFFSFRKWDPHILATLASNFYFLGSMKLSKALVTFPPFTSSSSVWFSVSHSRPRIRKYLKRIKIPQQHGKYWLFLYGSLLKILVILVLLLLLLLFWLWHGFRQIPILKFVLDFVTAMSGSTGLPHPLHHSLQSKGIYRPVALMQSHKENIHINNYWERQPYTRSNSTPTQPHKNRPWGPEHFLTKR